MKVLYRANHLVSEDLAESPVWGVLSRFEGRLYDHLTLREAMDLARELAGKPLTQAVVVLTLCDVFAEDLEA